MSRIITLKTNHETQGDPNETYGNVQKAVEEFRKGNMVCVRDNEDRENEADLIGAARFATAQKIAFLVRNSTGIVCAPMTENRAKRLRLPMMVENSESEDPNRTAYTVTCDSKNCSTGVSAADRVKTLYTLGTNLSFDVRAESDDALINDKLETGAEASMLRRPGHILPLVARDGGVLERGGHTESAVDLCKWANIDPPVAYLAELTSQEGESAELGEMMRGAECERFCKQHRIASVTVEELQNYARFVRQQQQEQQQQCEYAENSIESKHVGSAPLVPDRAVSVSAFSVSRDTASETRAGAKKRWDWEGNSITTVRAQPHSTVKTSSECDFYSKKKNTDKNSHQYRSPSTKNKEPAQRSQNETTDGLSRTRTDEEEIEACADCNVFLHENLGQWRMHCYIPSSAAVRDAYYGAGEMESYIRPHVALVRGDPTLSTPLCRVHSECFTGDVLGSQLCDCGEQLETSMRLAVEEDRAAIVIIMSGHEGRGIGLVHKVRAYRLLQEHPGIDTYEANKFLGLPEDARDYSDAVRILRSLCSLPVELLTQNPEKARALGRMVASIRPLACAPSSHNASYLDAKTKRHGTERFQNRVVEHCTPATDLGSSRSPLPRCIGTNSAKGGIGGVRSSIGKRGEMRTEGEKGNDAKTEYLSSLEKPTCSEIDPPDPRFLKGKTAAIVVSMWHFTLLRPFLELIYSELVGFGFSRVEIHRVPGTFETARAAAKLAAPRKNTFSVSKNTQETPRDHIRETLSSTPAELLENKEAVAVQDEPAEATTENNSKHGNYKCNVVIALGLLVEGDTLHFDLVARSTTDSLARLNEQLQNRPIVNAIMACHSMEQAIERCQSADAAHSLALTAACVAE